MSFNIAAIIGPVLGGQLGSLGTRFPEMYGDNWLLNQWPYAPPALANGVVMLVSLLLVFLLLEEVWPPFHDWFEVHHQRMNIDFS